MDYESADDVRLRLVGSIVKYNGVPVKVEEVVDKNVVMVTDLTTGKTSTIKWKELDLTPSALPLGYVQVDNDTVVLATRRPVRRYKQGLTNDNLHAVLVMQQPRRGRGEAPRGGRGNYPLNPANDAVVKTMMGKFTDIGQAFQKVRSGASTIQAFSKDWAVGTDDGELCVVYRGEVVGFVTDTTLVLRPDRTYLKESLELCLK
ncbi:hypothetical protein [Erwinia phage Pecta]|nr:hypothetical protein [Erwinia phage Pecta]